MQGDPAAVRDAALAAAPGLVTGSTDVSVTWVGARGEPVTVSVAYASGSRVPLVGWILPSTVSMRSSVTARQEFG